MATGCLLAVGSLATVTFGWGKKVDVASLPPVVVRTVPQAGDTKVDPALREISVTYSKDMIPGSWAWVKITSESYPEFTGKARYLPDKRTCVAPVKLEPGHAYAIGFNHGKFQGFKDAGGQPAMPYVLVFETRR